MKKLTIVLLILLSSFFGHAQIDPQPTQANDWNSTRSNKTSKTSRVINPNENENNEPARKTINQLSMILQRIPSNGTNVYVSMPDKDLLIFNKLSNPDKKLYFSNFVSTIINRLNPKDKINKEDLIQSNMKKWCKPCPLYTRTDGGTLKIVKKGFIYKIYFSKGGRKDVEKVIITNIVGAESNPSFAIDPEEDGGFCYRQLDLNIDTTLEPIPENQPEFCMDNSESSTQRIANQSENEDRHSPFGHGYRPITPSRKTIINISSGISVPSSTFKNVGFANNGSFIEFNGSYYFSNFGIGLSFGQLSNTTNSNFSDLTRTIDLPTTNSTQNWKQFYYGIGPEYKAQFGKLNAIFSAKIGLQSVKSINLESNNANGESPIAILKVASSNTSLSYFSSGVKFGYSLNSNLSLYATANYMNAFSNDITISKSKLADINRNGIIDAEDLSFAIGSATIDYDVSTKKIKPQSTNFGIGIRYIFNIKKNKQIDQTQKQKSPGDPVPDIDIIVNTKRKRPGRTKYANVTLKRGKKDNSSTQKQEIFGNSTRSNKTSKTSRAANPQGNDSNDSIPANNHNTSRSNKRHPIVGDKQDIDENDAKNEKTKTSTNDGQGYTNPLKTQKQKSPGDPVPDIDIIVNTKRKRPGRTKYANVTLKRGKKDNSSTQKQEIFGNSTRSNKTSKTSRAANPQGNDGNDSIPANNHNTSRSNKRHPIVGDNNNDEKNNVKGKTKKVKADLIIKSEGAEAKEEKTSPKVGQEATNPQTTNATGYGSTRSNRQH